MTQTLSPDAAADKITGTLLPRCTTSGFEKKAAPTRIIFETDSFKDSQPDTFSVARLITGAAHKKLNWQFNN